MLTMSLSLAETRESKSAFKSLFAPHIRKPVLICVFLFFFQQFSGTTAVVFNLEKIFKVRFFYHLSITDPNFIKLINFLLIFR